MADNLPPLSLYLHFPWCVAKCPYCDFNSHSLRGELPAAGYIDALRAEIARLPEDIAARPLRSIFMGGGTPSLFSPRAMHQLLDAVRERCTLIPDAEVTMEANPGALEHAAFEGYLAAGINRLSLGVQSFDDAILQRLGRVHDSHDALTAFRQARAAGFANINIDLMYALPGQDETGAIRDVECALELQPEHVSHYHLTLEPNTVFYSRPPSGLPDADLAWSIQAACAAPLHAAGYENYEVSAWAQPRKPSCHNLNYWNFGDYVGLGAGAHGKVSRRDGAGALQVSREVRVAHPREYQRQALAGNVAVANPVSPADLVFEFMLNALRLKEGVELSQFAVYTGLSADALALPLAKAYQAGLLANPARGRIKATPRGWRFLDDLQAMFLPEPGEQS